MSARASRAAVGALLGASLLAACHDPPVIRSVDVAGDTQSPVGPYEVRVTATARAGLGASRVVVDDGSAAPLVVYENTGLHARLRGAIAGRPLGTRVRFAVEVCDVAGVCVVDPPDFPAQAHAFDVGDVPPRPRITEIAPTSGPASGGQRVTVRGARLAAASVSFGGAEALHVEHLSDDVLIVVTPPGAVGLVDVSFSTADGGTSTLVDGYAYLPAPRVDAVTPGSGPERGGTALLVQGADFPIDARVLVDGVPCRDVAFLASDLLSCTTPPGRGVAAVEVVDDAGGRSAIADGFSYVPAPRVDAVTPDRGSSDGGTVITVIGEDFGDDAVVSVGDHLCLDVVAVDGGLRCTSPAGTPGVVDVVVENSDGQRGVLPGGFAWLGPPVVVEVVPDSGPITGGTTMRVLGAGLDATDDVSFAPEFGGARAEVLEAVDDIELVVLLPAFPGPVDPPPDFGRLGVDVQVTRTRPEDTRAGVLQGGFSYVWPPVVNGVTPPSGPTAGGTEVVVVGRFFTPETTVTFDGAPCRDVRFLSSTSVACTTPPGEPGFADVVASNDARSPGTGGEGAFEYVPPPRIDGITPADGPVFGGERVTVSGAFFREGAVVLIDGAACTDVVFVSAGALTCTTPAGERGPADVSVVNPDGQDDTAEGIYEYVGVSVAPDHGLPVGFTRVRVRAAGMQEGVRVTFDDVVATCSRASSREVVCQTPPRRGGRTGPVRVAFTNPDGTGDGDDDAFTYTAFVERTRGRIETTGRNANHVVVADLDDDRDLDLVVANGRVGTPESAELFRNDGAGVFVASDIPGTEVTGNKVDLGSVDDDDIPDLVFAASDGIGAVLLQSTGPAEWATVPLPLQAQNSAFDALLADLLGDPRDDLLVLAIGCDPVIDFEQTPGCDPLAFGVDVLFEQTGQDGGSVLSRRNGVLPHDAGQVHDHKMVVLDLEGDGDNDVFVVVNNERYRTAQNRVLRNRVREGLGFVKETAGLGALVGDLYDVDAGDIDGDGDDDVVTSICFGDGEVSSEVVLRNDDGVLVVDDAALPVFQRRCTVGTRLLDLDGDGDLDALWTGTNDDRGDLRLSLRAYVNRGDGSFVDASAHVPAFDVELQGNHVDGGDLDGDGDLDVVLAGGAPYRRTELPGAVKLFLQE